MLFCISNELDQNNLNRIRDSKLFGLMTDESTNVSAIENVVVFETFVEK